MARQVRIVVGPEDAGRLEAIASGRAPRLDYRLVAARCQAAIEPMYPSPSALQGPKGLRLWKSIAANYRGALRLLGHLPIESTVYSTGETWGLPLGLASGARRKARFKHVVYAHRVYSPSWLRLVKAIQPILHVDTWICVTRHQADLLCRALGPGSAPVHVVSQGVDTTFFDPAQCTRSSSASYILSVGSEMRDFRLLFQAVRNLNVELIVKASSAWMEGVRTLMPAPPPNVTLMTDRIPYAALRDLYAGARLVVLSLCDTSQAAGITSTLEAMAMGKCVVATRSPGLTDALVGGETGLVVEPRAECLAGALGELLDSPLRVTRLAGTAQQQACESYSLEAHAAGIQRCLGIVPLTTA